MMGAGAPVPGYSAHDQALTMLKVASDAKATKERLEALDKHTAKHHETKAAAEKATQEALKAATALSKREADLATREERLKTDTEAHNRNREQSEALHQDRAAALAERAAVFDKERKEHSEKVNDFARYRERELAAIQKKAAEANRLHEAAEADRKETVTLRGEIEARIAKIREWIEDVAEGAKRL